MTVWVIEHREVPGRAQLGETFEVAYFSRGAAEDAIRRQHGSYGLAYYAPREATLTMDPAGRAGKGTR